MLYKMWKKIYMSILRLEKYRFVFWVDGEVRRVYLNFKDCYGDVGIIKEVGN